MNIPAATFTAGRGKRASASAHKRPLSRTDHFAGARPWKRDETRTGGRMRRDQRSAPAAINPAGSTRGG